MTTLILAGCIFLTTEIRKELKSMRRKDVIVFFSFAILMGILSGIICILSVLANNGYIDDFSLFSKAKVPSKMIENTSIEVWAENPHDIYKK